MKPADIRTVNSGSRHPSCIVDVTLSDSQSYVHHSLAKFSKFYGQLLCGW